MITVQQVFLFLGIAAFVCAAVFLGLAVYTFFHEDIRGVMDDLSGRRRAGAAGARRASRRASHAVRPTARAAVASGEASAPTGPGTGGSGSVGASAASGGQRATAPSLDMGGSGEDGAATVVDEELGVTKRSIGIDFGRPVEEDGLPTQVASDMDDELLATQVVTETEEPAGADEPTQVASPDDAPTEVAAAPVDAGVFRVTRRVISVSSSEVIVDA